PPPPISPLYPHRSPHHPDPHSFPTRRSSDLFEEPGNYIFERNVPVREIETDAGPVLVTTVFDIMCAQTGVNRGIAGDTPTTYEDDWPYTPAWQEKYTNVQPELVAQIAREFAQNAIDSKGRSMIIMGSGMNHW